MAKRILLQNGCSMSTPSISPKNWKTGGIQLLKKDWRVQYYFFDPQFEKKHPYGKLIIVKGMNSYKTIPERREAAKVILQNEIDNIRAGYNPILKTYVVEREPGEGELHPDLYFIDAFFLALENFNYSYKHKRNMKGYLRRLEKAAIKLKLTNVTIDLLRRRQLKSLLDYLNLSDYSYNKYRSYLGSLFSELIEYECCETNLCRDIRKKKTITNKRETLTPTEFKAVSKHLKSNCYEFWRFSQIFMYSGARISELMRLQKKDVDLENQEYTAEIRKGGRVRFVQKVILKHVIPLWREVMDQTKPNEYLFSAGLVPGKEKIESEKIGKRWKRWVKDSNEIKDKKGKVMNITADFYSMKHTQLDSLPIEVAQILASHTTTQTTSIYQVNKEKREREILKKLEVKHVA